YSPVRHSPVPERTFSSDLHVLGLPPAFVLSQDQTLMFNPSLSKDKLLKTDVCTFFGGYHKPIWHKPNQSVVSRMHRLNAITLPAHPFLLIYNVKELQSKSPSPPSPRRRLTSAAPRR